MMCSAKDRLGVTGFDAAANRVCRIRRRSALTLKISRRSRREVHTVNLKQVLFFRHVQVPPVTCTPAFLIGLGNANAVTVTVNECCTAAFSPLSLSKVLLRSVVPIYLRLSWYIVFSLVYMYVCVPVHRSGVLTYLPVDRVRHELN